MANLIRKEITYETLPLIRELFHTIFPNEVLYCGFDGGIDCFEKSLHEENFCYYITYLDDIPIAISGKYYEPEDLDSLWLGWFGVLKEYRKQGYGTKIFEMFEDDCRNEHKKFCRLYTGAENNDHAINFYKSKGYFIEPYNGEYPKDMNETVVIASKSISGDKLVLWNNRPMDF